MTPKNVPLADLILAHRIINRCSGDCHEIWIGIEPGELCPNCQKEINKKAKAS